MLLVDSRNDSRGVITVAWKRRSSRGSVYLSGEPPRTTAEATRNIVLKLDVKFCTDSSVIPIGCTSSFRSLYIGTKRRKYGAIDIGVDGGFKIVGYKEQHSVALSSGAMHYVIMNGSPYLAPDTLVGCSEPGLETLERIRVHLGRSIV